MSKWAEKRLEDIIDVNPPVKLKKGESYPFIDIDKVSPVRRSVTNEEEKIYDGQSSSKFCDGDTVFSRITPCLENRKIAKVSIDGDAAFGSTEFYVFRAKKKKADARFTYYLTSSDAVVLPAINSMTGASGRQRADKRFIQRLKLNLPDLPTQERIADILSAYDDLIEANNRRIELLEQAAQELYKEWFVRFRFPGCEMVKFENGIPVDWNISKLSQISDFVYGKMPQQEHVVEKGFPIFSGYRVSGYYDSFMFEEPMLVVIARGVGGTGEVKISPPCAHITNLAIVFKLNNPNLHKRYLYHMFTLQNLRYLDTGAAQSQITIENLKNVKVILPREGLLEKFDKIITPFYEEQGRLKSINENLINQRDLLLPRLMSGKLEV